MPDVTLQSFMDTFLTSADVAGARTNLGLGGAATLNVGTTTGTVAAGDDARLSGTVLATSLTYSGTLTPNCADGLYRKVTMTGDLVINAPTNATEGMIWRGRFLASGASRELTFHASIKTPFGSTYEATVGSGATRLIHLEYDGSRWIMVRNLEFSA